MIHAEMDRRFLEDDIRYYSSPFSYRYGTSEMRELWGEKKKRDLWRKIWLQVLDAQMAAGLDLVEEEKYKRGKRLHKHLKWFDLFHGDLIKEEKVKHDIVAALLNYEESNPDLSGVLHIGMTSSDVVDFADQIKIRESIDYMQNKVKALLYSIANFLSRDDNYKTMVLSRTHLQPAGVTILAERFYPYFEMARDIRDRLRELYADMQFKGIRGSSGTDTSFLLIERMTGKQMEPVRRLGIERIEYCPTQTYNRTRDLWTINTLSVLASSLHKMHQDIRIMQMEGILYEMNPDTQVGSSAIPAKRNPITSEKICGLTRRIPLIYQEFWTNASLQMLERTLDDSSSRRYLLPEVFLTMSEILTSTENLLNRLKVNVSIARREIIKNWKGWIPELLITCLIFAHDMHRDQARYIADFFASQDSFKIAIEWLKSEGLLDHEDKLSQMDIEEWLYAEEPEDLLSLFPYGHWMNKHKWVKWIAQNDQKFE